MTANISTAVTAALTMVVLLISGAGMVRADSQTESAISSVRDIDPARTRISVYSAAMDRTVTVDVLSMGALSAVTQTIRHPELYRGVVAFSGCLDTVSASARLVIRNSVRWMGGNPENMWGTDADPAWRAHDPLTNAPALRGKAVYVSAGSGIPGPESLTDQLMPQAVTFGAVLEYLVHGCTESFQRRLQDLGVPATVVFHPLGTHSWPYWQEDLHESWPILDAALTE
ncbi:alpha/beta hydrolase [Nocardia sp. NPDC059239]|uniref:alpha/beta hydrolase n=1 Tax=unclassified Nocardia TaxID=2637762 RepID=UPI003684C698